MSAPSTLRRVLFVCDDNAIRSQIAEGWLRHLADDRLVVRSAGVTPLHLHPLATRVMQEVGIEIAAQRGKGLAAVRTERFDVVVTLSDDVDWARAGLPSAPQTCAHAIDDPTLLEDDDGPDIDEFRRVREALRAVAEALLQGEDASVE